MFYAIDVLKKQCIDGEIKWVKKQQLISVACTCTRPTVHEAKKKRLSDILFVKKRLSENMHIYDGDEDYIIPDFVRLTEDIYDEYFD